MATAPAAPAVRVLANPRRTRLVVMPDPHRHDEAADTSPRGEDDRGGGASKS